MLWTTFRPQANKYRAVNILSLNGETRGELRLSFFLFRRMRADSGLLKEKASVRGVCILRKCKRNGETRGELRLSFFLLRRMRADSGLFLGKGLCQGRLRLKDKRKRNGETQGGTSVFPFSAQEDES
ncbi:hypothetical protein ACFQFQ_08895 [Sulfitobacter porphyrae]|uniref:Uncharacterized protein n=1 Tax=Sulfitobacter porphyrae TaxID=1246864 RepID=A0ABW2B1J9_9RHOB